MALFDILVRLGLESKPFEKGMSEAERTAARFSQNVSKNFLNARGSFNALFGGVAGGLSIAGLVNGLKGLVNEADNIQDLSEQFGITTDEVQKLNIAFEEAGLKPTAWQTAIMRIDAFRLKLYEGNENAIELAQTLGMLEDFKGPKSSFELLKQLKDVVNDPTLTQFQKTGLKDILGKISTRMSGAISNIDSPEYNNQIKSPEDVKDLSNIGIAYNRVKRVVSSISSGVIGKYLDFVDFMGKSFSSQRGYESASRGEEIARKTAESRKLLSEMPDSMLNLLLENGDPLRMHSRRDIRAERTSRDLKAQNEEREKILAKQKEDAQNAKASAESMEKLQKAERDARLEILESYNPELAKIEKKKTLQREINNLMVVASEYDGIKSVADQVKANEARAEIAKKTAELFKLSSNWEGKDLKLETDSLAKVGVFSSLFQMPLNRQMNVEDLLRQIEKNTGKVATGKAFEPPQSPL